jgi:AcrR family transcriptional regulator
MPLSPVPSRRGWRAGGGVCELAVGSLAHRRVGGDRVVRGRFRDGVSLADVAGMQRARILHAMADLACERGAGSVTVAHVVERAGVSRRTFYETFVDREDCFLATFEQALRQAERRTIAAFEAADGWRGSVRAGLGALLGFFDEQPCLGRMLVCESQAGGAQTVLRRGEVVAVLIGVVDEGRGERGSKVVPPLTGEAVIGGALAVIQSRLLADPRPSLVELVNPLMSSIVLPYLGASAARRELAREVSRETTVPSHPGSEGGLSSDPFKEAGMRLTYRTVRVLVAIADQPNASNRIVGEAAGISDQGQTSKLLGRLKRIGLVSNSGLGLESGAPNAWTLTVRGREMTDALRAYATEDLQ